MGDGVRGEAPDFESRGSGFESSVRLIFFHRVFFFSPAVGGAECSTSKVETAETKVLH